jgi:hypothetical protein
MQQSYKNHSTLQASGLGTLLLASLFQREFIGLVFSYWIWGLYGANFEEYCRLLLRVVSKMFTDASEEPAASMFKLLVCSYHDLITLEFVIQYFSNNWHQHQGSVRSIPLYERKERESRDLLATCFHAGFLIGLFFDPGDGGDMFLRNIGWLSTDYTTLYPRRYISSNTYIFGCTNREMHQAACRYSWPSSC